MKDFVNILIVGDSPKQAAQLKCLLEEQGYSVAVTANGKEGIVAAREQQPSLIISDIAMPEMEGCNMTHAIKQDPLLQKIPVIILSTLPNPEDIVWAINAGADYYIIKPYDEDALLSSVKAILDAPVGKAALETPKELELIIDGKLYTVRSRHEQILTLFFFHLSERLGTEQKAQRDPDRNSGIER